jgi:hypothetical protein
MPKAVQWVTQMEQTSMEIGQPLLPQNWRDGETIGIRDACHCKSDGLK